MPFFQVALQSTQAKLAVLRPSTNVVSREMAAQMLEHLSLQAFKSARLVPAILLPLMSVHRLHPQQPQRSQVVHSAVLL